MKKRVIVSKSIIEVIEATRRMMEAYYVQGDRKNALRMSRKLDKYVNYYTIMNQKKESDDEQVI